MQLHNHTYQLKELGITIDIDVTDCKNFKEASKVQEQIINGDVKINIIKNKSWRRYTIKIIVTTIGLLIYGVIMWYGSDINHELRYRNTLLEQQNEILKRERK